MKNIALIDKADETERERCIELTNTIFQIYYTEREIERMEEKIFVDSIKESTRGHGLVLTNSK